MVAAANRQTWRARSETGSRIDWQSSVRYRGRNRPSRPSRGIRLAWRACARVGRREGRRSNAAAPKASVCGLRAGEAKTGCLRERAGRMDWMHACMHSGRTPRGQPTSNAAMTQTRGEQLPPSELHAGGRACGAALALDRRPHACAARPGLPREGINHPLWEASPAGASPTVGGIAH